MKEYKILEISKVQPPEMVEERLNKVAKEGWVLKQAIHRGNITQYIMEKPVRTLL
jgi:hypothetical protein